jgi:nicotinamide mononucleotide transporter
LIIYYILSEYADDPYPATDALVGSLSMLATYWVSGKHIENWLLWIVADIIAAVLFFSQELYATTALYVIYSVAAAAGYLHWRKFPRELK